MSDALIGEAVALASMLGALVAALMVISARSLFVTCVALMTMAAMAATALLGLGMQSGAIAFALFGVGLAPVFLLGAVLLSGRSAKSHGRLRLWLAGVSCALLAGALLASTPGLLFVGAAAPLAPPRGFSVLLAGLVFVAALTGVGLLGYGERGVLGAARNRP